MRTTELEAAARDLCRARCRKHRERATLRLERVLDSLDEGGGDLESLLADLVLFAHDYADEDPQAGKLTARCRKAGLL